MNFILRVIPWLILLLSFVILAWDYDSLPDEVLITRSFFGNETVLAPKSLFTVFRVPLIEAFCASAIEIMRRKFVGRNDHLHLMWSILLYTATLKSLFQSLEIVSTGGVVGLATIFFYVTFGAVVAGIISALIAARNHLSDLLRDNWVLSGAEKTILSGLLLLYLGLAIVPVFVFG